MTAKLLIVEDDETLRETLLYNLAKEYDVLTSSDGRDAIDMVHQHRPDLILLDVMLPGLDGFDVCRILRQEVATPIIMLTARADEIDRVVGLEMGADDYLTKPFSMRELQARVKALLRRVDLIRAEINQTQADKESVTSESPLIFGDLRIDTIRREVTLQENVLHLKPKEFELLIFLARNKGIALSRDLILERVWGWEHDGSSRTVDVHIRWLREKTEPNPDDPHRITTVRGMGYRFEG